jgi:hypothetical protein
MMFYIRNVSSRDLLFAFSEGQVSNMIDVKDAVRRAFAFTKDFQDVMNATSLTLEEVELSGDGKVWLVTLSYFDSAEAFEANLTGADRRRRYKLLRIDADSGQVLGMVFPSDGS